MKPILPDTTLSCVVCGETTASLWRVGVDHLLGGTHRHRAVKCVKCGTRRLDPRPDADTMAQYYAPDTYARAEEPESEVGKRLDAYAERLAAGVSQIFGGVFDKNSPVDDKYSSKYLRNSSVGDINSPVSDINSPVGDINSPVSDENSPVSDVNSHAGDASVRNLLDVGCGDGRFMQALKRRGWVVAGTETDVVAAELARNRTGAVVHGSALPHGSGERFDLVSLLHVLEHVPDPRQTLTDLRPLLTPDGRLLLVLPNADSLESRFFKTNWYHLDLPRHFWGFTPASLVRLVETCGFAVESVSYTPFLFAPQSLLRGFGAANGAIPGRHVQGTGRNVSGGAWQTRVFNALLSASDKLGKTFPGEIIELVATRSGA